MEKNPLLDFYVLIPCYNDQEGLIRSLESVHYAAGFSINIITLPSNQGIVKALNAGLNGFSKKKDLNL